MSSRCPQGWRTLIWRIVDHCLVHITKMYSTMYIDVRFSALSRCVITLYHGTYYFNYYMENGHNNIIHWRFLIDPVLYHKNSVGHFTSCSYLIYYREQTSVAQKWFSEYEIAQCNEYLKMCFICTTSTITFTLYYTFSNSCHLHGHRWLEHPTADNILRRTFRHKNRYRHCPKPVEVRGTSGYLFPISMRGPPIIGRIGMCPSSGPGWPMGRIWPIGGRIPTTGSVCEQSEHFCWRQCQSRQSSFSQLPY